VKLTGTAGAVKGAAATGEKHRENKTTSETDIENTRRRESILCIGPFLKFSDDWI
jgi:hypothetical protein